MPQGGTVSTSSDRYQYRRSLRIMLGYHIN